MTEREPIIDEIKEIIAQETGNIFEDIEDGALLEDELQITVLSGFPEVIKRINQEYNLDLDVKDATHFETVRDLALFIKDETVLG